MCQAFQTHKLVWLPPKSQQARLDRTSDIEGRFYSISGELRYWDHTRNIESIPEDAAPLRALALFYGGEALRRFFCEQLQLWTPADPALADSR